MWDDHHGRLWVYIREFGYSRAEHIRLFFPSNFSSGTPLERGIPNSAGDWNSGSVSATGTIETLKEMWKVWKVCVERSRRNSTSLVKQMRLLILSACPSPRHHFLGSVHFSRLFPPSRVGHAWSAGSSRHNLAWWWACALIALGQYTRAFRDFYTYWDLSSDSKQGCVCVYCYGGIMKGGSAVHDLPAFHDLWRWFCRTSRNGCEQASCYMTCSWFFSIGLMGLPQSVSPAHLLPSHYIYACSGPYHCASPVIKAILVSSLSCASCIVVFVMCKWRILQKWMHSCHSVSLHEYCIFRCACFLLHGASDDVFLCHIIYAFFKMGLLPSLWCGHKVGFFFQSVCMLPQSAVILPLLCDPARRGDDFTMGGGSSIVWLCLEEYEIDSV